MNIVFVRNFSKMGKTCLGNSTAGRTTDFNNFPNSESSLVRFYSLESWANECGPKLNEIAKVGCWLGLGVSSFNRHKAASARLKALSQQLFCLCLLNQQTRFMIDDSVSHFLCFRYFCNNSHLLFHLFFKCVGRMGTRDGVGGFLLLLNSK